MIVSDVIFIQHVFSCSLKGCIIELGLENDLYRPFKPAASAVQVFVKSLLCKVSLCHLLEDDWKFLSIRNAF